MKRTETVGLIDTPVTFTDSNSSITFYPYPSNLHDNPGQIAATFSVVFCSDDGFTFSLSRIDDTTKITVESIDGKLTSVARHTLGTEFSSTGTITADMVANWAWVDSDIVGTLDRQLRHEYPYGRASLKDIAYFFNSTFYAGLPTATSGIWPQPDVQEWEGRTNDFEKDFSEVPF